MRALVIGAGAVGARTRQLVEQADVEQVGVVDGDRSPGGRGDSLGRQGRRRRGGLGRTSWCSPGHAARTRPWPPTTWERAGRWCRPATRSRTCAPCSTWAPRRRLVAWPWSSAPRSRRATPACWPATPPALRHRHRAARRPQRHRWARLCPAAPSGAHRPGARLAGRWVAAAARRVGSGLCWFPDPIGAEDCYRAELPMRCSWCRRSRGWSGSRHGWRHAARPPLGPPAHAAQAAPRGTGGRRSGGGARPPGRAQRGAGARGPRQPGRRGRRHRRPGRPHGPCRTGDGGGGRARGTRRHRCLLSELAGVGIKAAVFDGDA